MLNRRTFLKISGIISAALSLFPLSFGKKLLSKIQESSSGISTYFAEEYGDGIFVLHSENPNTAKPPVMTYWEYLQDCQGYWDEPGEITDDDLDIYDISRDQLEDICPVEMYEDWWWEWYSSTIDSFNEFYIYNDEEILGRELHENIEWTEGPHPGSNYVAVEFRSKETLLAFQKKLNELGHPVNIEFVNWDKDIYYGEKNHE